MNTLPHLRRGLAVVLSLLACSSSSFAAEFHLPARVRPEAAKGGGVFALVETNLSWDAKRTAVVICDMWDKHWCEGATRRVGEMAPRMNEFVKKARAQGALIFHCPSDTMKFYADAPGRKLAQSAPKVETKVPLMRWCSLDKGREGALPIDDSDGGCDSDSPPPKGPPYPWTRQISTIEVMEGDAITDSAEAYYLMRQRGIENVMVMGVHLNMCVLGRPFSIRQMVNQGMNVVLVRDLTDTMYNPKRAPYVPHVVGNDLMVEHVERFWCPTIASTALLGGEPMRFKEDVRPTVMFLVGDEEYKTAETVPAWARAELAWRGLNCTFIIDDPKQPATLAGLDKLPYADALFISLKRRALTPAQFAFIRLHIDAGKPVLGIRTASHAFGAKKPEAGRAAWDEFDREVFGGHYQNHYGKGPATVVTVARTHELATGLPGQAMKFTSSLYKSRDLAPGTTVVLSGTSEGKPDFAEPVAWTRTDGGRKNFYTSLGAAEDFAEPGFRRLLLNAVLWAVAQPLPPANATLAKP